VKREPSYIPEKKDKKRRGSIRKIDLASSEKRGVQPVKNRSETQERKKREGQRKWAAACRNFIAL